MNLLAIETATNLVGAALVTDHGSAERSHVGGRRHAEALAPAVEEVCAAEGITVRDVNLVAVDVGPGLFTGLRVGVGTAKALAQGLGVRVLGVSSLDVLVAGAMAMGAVGPVMAVVDARRGEVFVGHDGKTQLMTPEELTASLTSGGEPVVLVGDGAVRYRQLFRSVADVSLADQVSSPSPLTLAHLAQTRLDAGIEPQAPIDIVVDYRREADAQINWEQRAPKVPER